MRDHSATQLVDHLFRHEAGRMVAVLTRIFGMHNLDLAEDVVQESFIKALQTWSYHDIPENPSAWLMQVAKRKTIDHLRKRSRDQHHEPEYSRIQPKLGSINDFFLDHEIADSQLRLIFACCHPDLKTEDQIALTLKTASGFGIREIAKALMISEDAVKQRLSRARKYIIKNSVELHIPSGKDLDKRLNTVLTILYLLFNEGYNSVHKTDLIRKDLCAESMRLAKLLMDNSKIEKTDTAALLALMCFQAARFDSRLDAENQIVLLPYQDRTKWDTTLISLGNYYIQRSLESERKTIFHLEASIAAQHTLAPAFEETNWKRLLKLYETLYEVKPSPIIRLNTVVVLLQLKRIDKALNIMSGLSSSRHLAHHYLYYAVFAEVYFAKRDYDAALGYLEKAKELTKTEVEKSLLTQKVNQIMARS